MLPGGPQHAKEHGEIDVRHVREVREEVLRPDPHRVDLVRSRRDGEGEVGRHAAPEGAHHVGHLLRDPEQRREDEVEKGYTVEGARDVSRAAAHQDEPPHPLGPQAVRLERDLAAHRVADQDTGRVAHVAADGIEIGRVVDDVDVLGIGRRRAPPVSAVVPVHHRVGTREIGPSVLPDEAVAQDAVTEDQVKVA